ncbi:DUF6216 family protein [Pantoea allii]|uniref:DUF6216 family protein n=1 Tax=Pantoea allii TaxID=574096 RepID=UPI001F4EFB37|nr:DUF6216 family protein [Pantoea allii]MCH9300372.1 DUF6216 family protein [Pantoea allii]
MENQLSVGAILNAPWLIALLPTLLTMVLTVISKLNSPLKENADYFKDCGIPPLILRLSLSRTKLKEQKPYNKAMYIFTLTFSLFCFSGAGWLTYLLNKNYHESPDGWALLKLKSTNELFLISLNEATSPDRKGWILTPKICASQTFDNIASRFKISDALVYKICTVITFKSEEPEIRNWIAKVHDGALKLIIFFTPILLLMYWFATALFLDAALKFQIDKYNQQQAERAKLYLT